MGLFSRKDKGQSDRLKGIKRKYGELRRRIEETPEKYGQAHLERLLNYEQELLNSGVDVERTFGSALMNKFQPTNITQQSPQAPFQFAPPSQPMHPSQTPYQQTGYEQRTVIKHGWGDANKNDEFTSKEEIINPATGEQTTIVRRPVTPSGEIISADKLKFFCAECNRPVSQDDLVKCAGYEQFGCNKVLCQDHVLYFKDAEGKSIPCCAKHYKMRCFYQKV